MEVKQEKGRESERTTYHFVIMYNLIKYSLVYTDLLKKFLKLRFVTLDECCLGSKPVFAKSCGM